MLNLKLARDREGVPPLGVRIRVNANTTGSELIGHISGGFPAALSVAHRALLLMTFAHSRSGTVDSVSSPVVWDAGANSAEIFEHRTIIEEHQIPEEWLGREVVTVFHMPPEAQVYALQFTGCDPLATMAAF